METTRDDVGRFMLAGDDPQIVGPLQRRKKRIAAPTPPIKSNARWITRAQLAERWNCSIRTLERNSELKLIRLAGGLHRYDLHIIKRVEAEAAA